MFTLSDEVKRLNNWIPEQQTVKQVLTYLILAKNSIHFSNSKHTTSANGWLRGYYSRTSHTGWYIRRNWARCAISHRTVESGWKSKVA